MQISRINYSVKLISACIFCSDVINREFIAEMSTYWENTAISFCPLMPFYFEWLIEARNLSIEERLVIFWKEKRDIWTLSLDWAFFQMTSTVSTLYSRFFLAFLDFLSIFGSVGDVFFLCIFYYDSQYSDPAFWYPRMISWLSIFLNLSTILMRIFLTIQLSFDEAMRQKSAIYYFNMVFVRFVNTFLFMILNYLIISLEFCWLFVKFLSTTRNFKLLNQVEGSEMIISRVMEFRKFLN